MKGFRKAAAPLVMIIILALGLAACATLNPGKDPKTDLYLVKQNWMAVRETAVNAFLDGQMTANDFTAYREADAAFTVSYNAARTLVLKGATSGTDYDAAILALKNMLLEANAKYAKKEVTK